MGFAEEYRKAREEQKANGQFKNWDKIAAVIVLVMLAAWAFGIL